MAGQTIINFDGLSSDSAKELAEGMSKATKVRIEAISENVLKLKNGGIDMDRIADMLGRVADGNCGNGCA